MVTEIDYPPNANLGFAASFGGGSGKRFKFLKRSKSF